MPFSRRHFLASTSTLLITQITSRRADASKRYPDGEGSNDLHPAFPSQDPRLVRDIVGASHGNVERVRELVKEHPALAKATLDWGFGDWETALGAASHVGNREIAELLMANGARPDIFTFAMLGQLDAVNAMIVANPGVQRLHGPHGLTLMHHALQGGSEASDVAEYLRGLGDADLGHPSVPMSDDEKQFYSGQYAFGPGETERLLVDTDNNGKTGIKRLPEGVRRVLFYQGNHEFHPAGAPSVRIRFAIEGGGTAGKITIVDGNTVLTALRTGG